MTEPLSGVPAVGDSSHPSELLWWLGNIARLAVAAALVLTGACTAPEAVIEQGPSAVDPLQGGDGGSGGSGGSSTGGAGGSAEEGSGSAGSGGSDLPSLPECDDGDTRKCHVVLPSHEGVNTCYEGLEFCESGTWSDCRVGT